MSEETALPLNGFLEGLERPVVDAFVDEDLEVEEHGAGGFQPIAVLLTIVDDAFGFAECITAAGDEQVEDVMLGDEGVETMVDRTLENRR